VTPESGSVQRGIDASSPGATINVLGGTYTEGHANVDYFGVPGGGQNFGLHVYKDNLLIRGFNASGASLSGLDDPEMPVVTAQFQTGFGAQHFVSGSGVTIDGIKFKPVSTGNNKTFEVIGNDFTLKNSVIDNSGNATAAAFYISDFAIDGRPEVESFTLENNRFIAGTTASALVVVASGAGNSTAASNRILRNNQLIGNPALVGARGFQIQGQMTGIPWQPYTAGAVTVESNTFSNLDAPVRTVGILTEQFDWNSVFNGNTFVGGAALAFAGDTTTARANTVAVAAQDGTGTTNQITDTRITRGIQSSIDRAQSGDTVRALAGTYAESVVLDDPRNLRFDHTTIQGLTVDAGAAGSGIGGSVTASGSTGFLFDAPIRLLSDTSLATTGAGIALNGDIQTAGGAPYALSLNAGGGDVSMVSGGTQANPLGYFNVLADDFSLAGTLWVSGYDIDARGNVALSDHTLRSAGAGLTNVINAGGNVSGSTIAGGGVQIRSAGNVAANVTSQAAVVVAAANVSGNFSAQSIAVAAQETVNVAVQAPGPVGIHSGGSANVSGSAPALTIDAPSGSASGSFGQVTNTGGGLIDVNGKPQVNTTLAASADNSRIVPAEVTTAASVEPGGTAPRSGKLRRHKPEDALEALENGEAFEIDLSPGND
jgi:hypothetical protein